MKPVRLLAGVIVLVVPSFAGAQSVGTAVPSAVEIVLAIPFENAGSASAMNWMGEGLAELTARRLSSANRVVLPRSEWLAAADRLGLGSASRLTRASLLKVAQEADADFIVFGSYAAAGKQLTLTAQGLRLSGPALSPPLVESGLLDELVEVHARLSWRLLQFFDPTLPFSRQDYVKRAGRLRVDALENYVRGLAESGAERLRLLQEATRLEPDWPDPAFALGHAYFEAGNFESALIWFSRVPPAAAVGLEAGFFSGVCHLMRNDAPRAEAAFRAILERPWYPGENSASAARRMDLPEVLNNLAIALSRQGKWREASALWTQVRQLAPVEPAFAFNFGLSAIRAGEYEQAVRALREAIRLRADDDARALLVGILERMGRKEEAGAERAGCGSADCDASEEVKAVLSRAGSPSAAARLDRVSTSIDLLTWFLTGQSRGASAAGDSNRNDARPPLDLLSFAAPMRKHR